MITFAASFFILATTLCAAEAEPPAPAFDERTAMASVIVATSQPGQSYATPEECTGANVICMHFPLWFKASVIRPVYGTPEEQEMVVATYTHYGQPEPDTAMAPRILLLLSNGDRHLMPVYASERVWRRSDGHYYIFVYGPDPIHWLPCSVQSLREPISDEGFSSTARLAGDDYWVKEHPHLFTTTGRYAFPRFGISVNRLSEHLERLHPATKDFACDADDR